MAPKTSQLQIRVSPEQKHRLRRLAQDAGTSISEYVLARALPTGPSDLERSLNRLPGAADPHKALSDLILSLREEIGPGGPERPDLDGLSAMLQNRAAAAAELVASSQGRPAPEWARSVRPQPRPSFSQPLQSLKAHLMRLTPAPFKQRNVFVDVEAMPALVASPAMSDVSGLTSELAGLEALDRILGRSRVLGEVCVSGGAVFTIAYRAAWRSRHIDEVFAPQDAVSAATGEVSATLSLPDRWLATAARTLVGAEDGAGYLELPHLRVFRASSEYVLAAKCGAARQGATDEIKEDVRFLLRFSGVVSTDDALSRVLRYLTPRQLPVEIDRLLYGALQ